MFFLLRGLAVLEKNSSEGLSQDVRQTAQYMRSAAASEVHAGFRAVERLSQSAECVGPRRAFGRRLDEALRELQELSRANDREWNPLL